MTRADAPFLDRDRRLALGVLAVMVLHTWAKARLGTLPELLWACNVASFVLVLGLWFRKPVLVGTGFLWHLGIGDWAWAAGAWQQGHTGWTSVAAHSLPTLAAGLSLRRTGLPRACPYLALGLFVALVPLSHRLTPAVLNVNMTHQRLWLLQKHFPGNWDYRFAFSGAALALLLAVDWAAARWWTGRPSAVRAAA